MSIPSSRLAKDDWSRLEAAIEAFSLAWDEAPSPPDLAEHLARAADSLRDELAVELIKFDLERRWQCGLRRLVEDYLDEVPALRERLPAWLIFEEYHARKLAGDEVGPTEFFERFPSHAVELRELFHLDPQFHSTPMLDSSAPRGIGLAPGETIDDFDLLLRLGEGAFATVFLARQRSMQRLVAVKISADKGDEPQTLAQLDHDNIVRVYDQRFVAERELRLLYMQYAAGGTLADVISTLRRLPHGQWDGSQFLKAIDAVLDAHGESRPTDSTLRRKLAEMSWPQVVCWIGAQLARALDYAHRAGVLHRDLKPANVLLTAEGVPKLADFNISFSANVEGSSPAAYFGGSLAYMSPEQLEACNSRHERVASSLDGRSDLFSLGVLLWELLTGDRPFDDEEHPSGWATRLEEMTERRQRGVNDFQRLGLRHADAPGLDEVLPRCLAAQPADRHATGLELAKELELCLQPDARRLLNGSAFGWQRWARRWPVVTVAIITLIPNVVAAVFNFLYNHGEILTWRPDAEPTFMRIQMIINLIAYPTGLSCAGWLAGSVGRATRSDLRAKLTVASLGEQRRRCLELGNLAAIVGLTLWLIAAPAYPISLHLMLGDVPTQLYGHFLASLALCGLIAAAYPFFGVSFVAVRCFYPTLVQWESMSRDDVASLQRLSRQTWLYLVLAASVPMVAVMIVVVCGLHDHRFALVVLAAGGTLGFGIAVTAFRLVQSDLAILTRVISRSDR